MKYTFKEGLTISEARAAYCTRHVCDNCKLSKEINGFGEGCDTFCIRHPKEAAKIMEIISIGDQQTLAHKDADGIWVLNDPPSALSEQKPIAEWTLREAKNFCGQRSGICLLEKCLFYRKSSPTRCKLNTFPEAWELDEFTERDIEDAKAVRRIFPQIKYIKKDYNILDQIIRQDTLILGETSGFPNIKNKQTVAITEILADEQNSVDGQNKED